MSTPTHSEQIRAGIISFISSLLPVLILANVVSLDADGLAVVMLCVSNFVTLAFLLLPNKVPDA